MSSKSYHIEIQTHRKNPYGLLRNSYRKNGKTVHDTICRFSGLTMDQLRAMQAAMQGKTVMKEEFKIISSREFGASFTCASVLREIGLDKAIYSRPAETWVRDCIAMITGRLVYAGSKLSLSNCNSFSALWGICGINDDYIDVGTHCYNSMDRLLERQEKIQKSLVNKHLKNGILVLYDITSSYFEGEYEDSEIVKFGYNRDKKKGHKQIVISLLCNKEGCPLAVEVFEGNTKDETTVLNKINDIKNKYGIEKIVFVGDRGMVTSAQYEKIDHNTIKVISALTHNNIKTLCEKDVIQLSLFDERNIVEIIDGDIRYSLCKNPFVQEKESRTRLALLGKTKVELDKIIESTRKSKYSKEVRVGKVVNKYSMGKFVKLEGSGDDLKWSFDKEQIEQEQVLDGCYIIYTDVPVEDMTTLETVENYKNLMKVEQAFRNLKTVRLEIRPMFHKTDNRIRCHVFICMLAYYIMWHMNQKLQPLFESDGRGKHRKYTFEYIIECLKCIREEKVDFCGTISHTVTTPTVEQKEILDLLQVKI